MKAKFADHSKLSYGTHIRRVSHVINEGRRPSSADRCKDDNRSKCDVRVAPSSGHAVIKEETTKTLKMVIEAKAERGFL